MISLRPQELTGSTVFKPGLYVGMIRNEKAVPKETGTII